ncbi:hypothetical protein MC885_006456 [Smutsia gigantea]|nr:hypothetical protein MC885_006456 [Smutsia gigantea]
MFKIKNTVTKIKNSKLENIPENTKPVTALGPILTLGPRHLLPPSQPDCANALGCSRPDIPCPNQMLTPDPGLTPAAPSPASRAVPEVVDIALAGTEPRFSDHFLLLPSGGEGRAVHPLPALRGPGSPGPRPRAPRRERDRLPPGGAAATAAAAAAAAVAAKAAAATRDGRGPAPARPRPRYGHTPRPRPQDAAPGPPASTAPGHGRRPERLPCARRSPGTGRARCPGPPALWRSRRQRRCRPPRSPPPPAPGSSGLPPGARASSPLPSRRCASSVTEPLESRRPAPPAARRAGDARKHHRADAHRAALPPGAWPRPPPLRSSKRSGRPSCPRLLENAPPTPPAPARAAPFRPPAARGARSPEGGSYPQLLRTGGVITVTLFRIRARTDIYSISEEESLTITKLGWREPPHLSPDDSQPTWSSRQPAVRPGPRRREGWRGWGRSAHGFPGDRAEEAGSCPAVGLYGTDELGAGREE